MHNVAVHLAIASSARSWFDGSGTPFLGCTTMCMSQTWNFAYRCTLREEIQVETVEENSGPFSSQPNTEDLSSDSSQVLNSDQANGKSSSSSDASGTAPTKWTKENVLL
ncbi:hypothetical protein MAR_011676 [Mya arenaria]|uniref:Uncharacterized protein n=1 Tax=Mya arenaria TaxID=6604 RepID=A0ABY7FV00_MYAAR|nr:hypothetical protein MAR_011676 [Mya arenaria]